MRLLKILALAALMWCHRSGEAGAAAGAPGTEKRIVSLAPSFTEILFALDLGGAVVGTTSYCDYPPAALKTEKVGDMMNPDVEKIISLRPDIVFAGHWKWEVPDKLRKVGIRVVEVEDAGTLADSLERITFFGKETGRQKHAAEIVASMQARIEAMRSRSGALRARPGVFVELDAGQWTVGGKSYINDILDVLGLANIFKDRSEPYLMVTMESIVSRNPDLLISLCRPRSEYAESPVWSAVKAVRNGKIIDQRAIDWNAITHQGPRLVDGMEALEKLVRPMFAHEMISPPLRSTRLRRAETPAPHIYVLTPSEARGAPHCGGRRRSIHRDEEPHA